MPTLKSKRITVKHLICEGLGFCCEYAFFKLQKRTGLIADRLGVTDRAIRYHKLAFKDGNMACERRDKCLKGKLL